MRFTAEVTGDAQQLIELIASEFRARLLSALYKRNQSILDVEVVLVDPKAKRLRVVFKDGHWEWARFEHAEGLVKTIWEAA